MKTRPTLLNTIRIPPDVLFQDVGGEAVLLDLAGGSYFGLDDVGTRIWQLFVEHGSLQLVQQIMLEEYAVEPTRLEDDLLELVGGLADAGLVILGAADAAAP